MAYGRQTTCVKDTAGSIRRSLLRRNAVNFDDFSKKVLPRTSLTRLQRVVDRGHVGRENKAGNLTFGSPLHAIPNPSAHLLLIAFLERQRFQSLVLIRGHHDDGGCSGRAASPTHPPSGRDVHREGGRARGRRAGLCRRGGNSGRRAAFDRKTRPRAKDGVPTGIRTPVTAVKGRCPRPLDDGDG
jgi:hypothetical protein